MNSGCDRMKQRGSKSLAELVEELKSI